MFVPIRVLIPSWRISTLTIFDSDKTDNAGEIIRSVRVICGIRRKRSPYFDYVYFVSSGCVFKHSLVYESDFNRINSENLI